MTSGRCVRPEKLAVVVEYDRGVGTFTTMMLRGRAPSVALGMALPR
jgi:hypothetical protein